MQGRVGLGIAVGAGSGSAIFFHIGRGATTHMA